MSNVLAFETSSPILSVALKKDDTPIREKKVDGFLSHAENLLPMIDELLKKASLKIEDIETFLIGRGPGSFTGLRIGFATLKGVQVLRSPDFFGALSLDLIAENVPVSSAQPLAICLDAHREKFYIKKYVKKYAPEGESWRAASEALTLSHEEALSSLEPKTLITGDALKRYSEKFQNSGKNFQLLPTDQWYPKASSLISLYERHLQADESNDSVKKLTGPTDFIPLYFRKSEAEERREESKK